jgi:uncharacterized protein
MMHLYRILALFLLLVWTTAGAGTGAAGAQALPDWQATTVNDFAGVLAPQDAQAVAQALAELRRDSGVQGTLVTLPDRARHGDEALEPFATRLFNHWGIGEADRNDGFMLLFLRDNHEARIELGRSYPVEADIIAQDIMSRVVLPALGRGEVSAGLRDGTLAVIDHIARPHAAGQAPVPPPRAGSGWGGLVAFLAAAAAMVGLQLRARARRNRCPQCGSPGLATTDTPLREDIPSGGWRTTQATRRQHCPACGWTRDRRVPLPVITHYDRDGRRERVEPAPGSGGGSGGFGGGSSGGGGASGRW